MRVRVSGHCRLMMWGSAALCVLFLPKKRPVFRSSRQYSVPVLMLVRCNPYSSWFILSCISGLTILRWHLNIVLYSASSCGNDFFLSICTKVEPFTGGVGLWTSFQRRFWAVKLSFWFVKITLCMRILLQILLHFCINHCRNSYCVFQKPELPIKMRYGTTRIL